MAPSAKTSCESGAVPRGNPTKERVLELLAEFFCLRTKDAATLLRNREITESDARSVRRTLAVLHRDGYRLGLILGVTMFVGALLGGKFSRRLGRVWLRHIYLTAIWLLGLKTLIDVFTTGSWSPRTLAFRQRVGSGHSCFRVVCVRIE